MNYERTKKEEEKKYRRRIKRHFFCVVSFRFGLHNFWRACAGFKLRQSSLISRFISYSHSHSKCNSYSHTQAVSQSELSHISHQESCVSSDLRHKLIESRLIIQFLPAAMRCEVRCDARWQCKMCLPTSASEESINYWIRMRIANRNREKCISKDFC